MSLLVISPGDEVTSWVSALKAAAPDIDVQVWPQVEGSTQVEAVLAWNPPPGELRRYPNLKAILSMGAGVDHLLGDPDLPDAPIARLVDPSLVQSMTEYVILAVLHHHRRFGAYRALQSRREWRPLGRPRAEDLRIGIMGFGQLGAAAARALGQLDFRVSGWSRARKALPGVTLFAGDDELEAFLRGTNVLVCLLPLTPETENILARPTFERLERGAYLINVARGRHLVEADLLWALETGQLCGACLDVFREEPLPPDHAFWAHPNIIVTPHVSSLTDPVSVAPQVVENYRRAQRGEQLLNLVDRRRAY